jgi:hypothetical protein
LCSQRQRAEAKKYQQDDQIQGDCGPTDVEKLHISRHGEFSRIRESLRTD